MILTAFLNLQDCAGTVMMGGDLQVLICGMIRVRRDKAAWFAIRDNLIQKRYNAASELRTNNEIGTG